MPRAVIGRRPPVPAVPHCPLAGAIYVWNSPVHTMLFDVRILTVDVRGKSATFEYLPPFADRPPDTRPWSQLFPKNDQVLSRRR